ncbi:hypothetical protein NM688_g616 [Phlebia brevispora]|uniref:Uncharacterized protein n=1 Tax=Phlebia brevispora TaxID=194682 RepID=A0ACC1TDL3_9APHY|nr:hypothetical protein NM688_g616 [Phlebia brevispora]
MIAEVLLVLAGHSSSLFPKDHCVHPSLAPLLHPGEQQCLESLGKVAYRYRNVKKSSHTLARSSSRYISALCVTLNQILKDEYEDLVVETEAKVLRRDDTLVASGSFVPLSAIRATFSEWDAPLSSLEALLEDLQTQQEWPPGRLIDMLLTRASTGVYRVASIYARLSQAVQRVWMRQLQAFVVHGSLSQTDPLVTKDYQLVEGYIPSCVTTQTRESIVYVGRAIGTVKAAKWEKQFPRDIAIEHTKLLDNVLPEEQHEFDHILGDIRTTVSEWLWHNVLTQQDVDEAVESLANYFLLRNGEFTLSLIREIERLKISRLTGHTGPTTMIREQDLHLALLRASLGTTAQHDPSLTRLKIHLPSGPLRPLLPSLATTAAKDISMSVTGAEELTSFDDLLLGTPLILRYAVSWPLDLFLHQSDLHIYAALFSYLSSLRKTHTRIHACWAALSNAQRARRRWTGLGEGGTAEDLRARQTLLRCGWGVVREMGWFLDTLLGQMTGTNSSADIATTASHSAPTFPTSHSGLSTLSGSSSYLDFSTLRTIHTTYLERLVTGTLLSNPALTALIRSILEVCERFVAQVERWGGDVLPALLFEGSLAGGDKVGEMVEGRRGTVAEINDTFNTLLESFYEQLSLSTTQQPFSAGADASKSMLYNMSTANVSSFHTFVRPKRGRRLAGDEEKRKAGFRTLYNSELECMSLPTALRRLSQQTRLLSASAIMSQYTTRLIGAPNTLEHRVYIEKASDHSVVSPFHDIPLFADQNNGILNMVVEVPRWTNAKMEISKEEQFNPIKQDIKRGRLRYVRNCFPHHGYIWNYGAFPQTWEDPQQTHPETKAKGDNDPLDVCEIGEQIGYVGQVKQVKVLDPLASKLNDIEDVENNLPGLIRATNEWFRIYKIPDGKPENQFAFSGEAKNKKYATEIIHECHEAWRKLAVTGESAAKTPSYDISILNTTIPGSPGYTSKSDPSYTGIPTDSRKPPAPIDAAISKWFYIASAQV